MNVPSTNAFRLILQFFCMIVRNGDRGKSASKRLVGATALFGLLAALPIWSGAQAVSTIRYQKYNSVGELLLIVAEDKFCSTYQLKCVGVLIPSGPLAIQALQGGSLEIAQVSSDVTIRSIANNADVRIMMGNMPRVPFHLMVRSDVQLPNKKLGFPAVIGDLRGKRIGVTARGAGVEMVFDLMLRAAGFSPTDVIYVPVGGPPTAFGSMRSKQIDAVVLFQPLPAMCVTSGLCESIMDFTRGDGPPAVKELNGAAATLVAKSSFLSENKDVALRYVKALQSAEAFIKDPANYQEVKDIAKKHIKIEVPDSERVYDLAIQEMITNINTGIRRDAVKSFVKLLQDRQLLARPLAVDDIVWADAPKF